MESGSWIRNRRGGARPSRSMDRFLACLGDPGRVRVGLLRGDQLAPRLRFDEHQDVEGLETGRLHAEEVARDDPLGVRPQELRPGGPMRLGAGPRPAFSQERPDRRAPPPGCPACAALLGCGCIPIVGSRGRDAGPGRRSRDRSEVVVASGPVRKSTQVHFLRTRSRCRAMELAVGIDVAQGV